MAKRGRPRNAESLDALVVALRDIDGRRHAVIEKIRRATNALLSGENPFPWGSQGRSQAKAQTSAAPRKRRKMSAAARKRISDAQKARWAKQKKQAKG